MKLLALEIPDEPEVLPTWLEGHLMGLDLHQVVSELDILSSPVKKEPLSLSQVLAKQADEVLQLGLRSLSRTQLRQLMNQPKLLLDLQRLVLDQGGSYWITVPESRPSTEVRGNTWASIQAGLSETASEPEPVKRMVWHWPWLWAGSGWLAAAAAVFFALFGHNDQVRKLEKDLSDQVAKLEHFQLQTQQQPADLAELPESDSIFVSVVDDTPEGDPADLPQNY